MNVHRSSAGFSLLELLAYLAVFAVVVNLAGSLFVSASRLRMMGNEAIQRMQALDEIARRFTEAVQSASGVADEAPGYASDEQTLILELPRGRFTVMGRLRGDDRLGIITFAQDTPAQPEFLVTFSHPVSDLKFARDQNGAVTMRIRLKHEASKPSTEHVFVACPRSVSRALP